MAMITLIFDGMITVLLAVTIYYCWKLNTYLNAIRDSKSELAQVIKSFDEATTRSQQSIEDLKDSTKKIADKIQVKIEKAEFLADDLAYMIDKGNKVAGKLSKEITQHRATQRRNDQLQGSVADDDDGMMPPEPAGILEEPAPRAQPKPPAPARAAEPSQGSGIEKIATKQAQATVKSNNATEEGGKRLSKAEMALMEALKSIK